MANAQRQESHSRPLVAVSTLDASGLPRKLGDLNAASFAPCRQNARRETDRPASAFGRLADDVDVAGRPVDLPDASLAGKQPVEVPSLQYADRNVRHHAFIENVARQRIQTDQVKLAAERGEALARGIADAPTRSIYQQNEAFGVRGQECIKVFRRRSRKGRSRLRPLQRRWKRNVPRPARGAG